MPYKFIKIAAINCVLISAVLGVFSAGPSIVYKVYHSIKASVGPASYIPMEIFEQYPWQSTYFKEFAQVGTEYADFIVWKSKAITGETINISVDGIRRTKYPEVTLSSSSRYLFFGPSPIWGTGSPDFLTIPSIFADLNSVETVNYGQFGYDSRQLLAYLTSLYVENKISDKKNVILFNAGVMEALNQLANNRIGMETPQQRLIRRALDIPILRINFIFMPVQQLIREIRSRINCSSSQIAPDSVFLSEAAEFAADITVRSWLMGSRLSAANHDQFIAVYPPTYALGHPYLNHLKYLFDGNTIEFIRSVHALIVQKVRLYPEINFIDLTGVFDGDDPIFIDRDGHYSPEGNRIYAEQLTEKIRVVLGNDIGLETSIMPQTLNHESWQAK